jgi:DNA polymerase-3 subunit beta
MKIKVDRKKFTEAFQLVGSVVSSSILNPLYMNVKLEVADQQLVLSATDLEVGVRTTLTEGLTVEEPGTVLLPEQNVSGVLRTSPDEEIEITSNEDWVRIVTADSNFRFPAESVEDFVSVPEVTEDKGFIEIDPATLTAAVKQTVFAIAEERDRYTLNGVYVNVRQKDIDLVGADGNRMALVKKKIVNGENVETHCIVPRKGADQLMRLGSISKNPIRILIDEHQIMARGDGTSLSSVLLEGQFPNYEQVIPSEPEIRIDLEKPRLQSVVQRAALVVTPESLSVTFNFKPGELVVESESPERGSATVKMPVEYDGKPFSVMFNPEYVEEFLRVCEREAVTVEYFGEKKPVMLRSGKDYRYFVMPISIEH